MSWGSFLKISGGRLPNWSSPNFFPGQSEMNNKISNLVSLSPQQAEKDEAIAIARRILNSGGAVTAIESQILSRQFLRALALSS